MTMVIGIPAVSKMQMLTASGGSMARQTRGRGGGNGDIGSPWGWGPQQQHLRVSLVGSSTRRQVVALGGGGGDDGSGAGHGQLEGEASALALPCTVHPDGAVVQIHDRLGDEQTEARTAAGLKLLWAELNDLLVTILETHAQINEMEMKKIKPRMK